MATKKLRLVVADDEELICAMLTKMIDFDGLGLELVGVAMDGLELTELIDSHRPDIVVTDISMPKVDGLKVVGTARQKGIQCKFIIISGCTQFEYAYNALKYDVNDYLLKPIDKDELNYALQKTINELNASGEIENSTSALHTFFVRNVIVQPSAALKSVAAVNGTYLLRIVEGTMRVIAINLDFLGTNWTADENMTSITGKIAELVREHMNSLCYETVLEEEDFSVIAFLNYNKEMEQSITEEIYAIFSDAKNIVGIFAGMTLTVCVSETVYDINHLNTAYSQVVHTQWTRRVLGTGRVIFYDPVDNELTPMLADKIAQIEKNYKKALDSLDSSGILKCLEEIFNIPRESLRKEAVRLLVKRIEIALSEKIEQLALTLVDIDEIRELYGKMCAEEMLTVTFKDLWDTLSYRMKDIIFRITKSLENKPLNPVRVAYQYVDQNFDKQITLDEIAKSVNLSPAYFSVFFKKETGMNLMDYVSNVKINKAKEYLRNTNMNVKEIAYALSFQDARYFSKLFKSKVGIKPTEYRKIYG
jgi:two-component system response regulator YesN